MIFSINRNSQGINYDFKIKNKFVCFINICVLKKRIKFLIIYYIEVKCTNPYVLQ